jgi:hypothetical protein
MQYLLRILLINYKCIFVLFIVAVVIYVLGPVLLYTDKVRVILMTDN